MDAPDRTLTRVAAALSAGAGIVHVGLAGEHAAHHWTMGVGFLVTGVLQLAWTGLLLLACTRRTLVAGAAVQLAAVAGLVATATVGWPVGPEAWQAEEVSTAALLCLAMELSAAAAAGSLLLGRVHLPRVALPIALVAVLASSSGALAAGGGHPQGADHARQHAHVAGDDHAPEEHVGAGHPSAAPHATGTRADPAAPASHGHGPVDTTPPAPEQQAAADALLRSSRATLKRYDLASVAEADGYRVVHDAGGKLLHYLHDGYARDGRDLDPQRIESLLYVVLPGGGKLLVGGMFTVPKGQDGPAVGGSLTPWHAHDDLCLDPLKGMAITQLPGGGCPPGSAVGTTGEMMHVWAVDYPGGPFGELDAQALRSAVLDVYGIDGQV